MLHLTAALFNALTPEDYTWLSGVKHLLTGGDVVSPAQVRDVLAASPGLHLVHCYGPTESTTFSITYWAEPGNERLVLAADWSSDLEHTGLCIGRGFAACTCGGFGGTLHCGGGTGAGLSGTAGSDGGAVCCGSEWAGWEPDVPDRGSGALAWGWSAGVFGPRR